MSPIHTTDEHPFLNTDGDWVNAQDLQVGDEVVSANGDVGIVEAIERIDEPRMMYNLSVAVVATYLVGAGRWVVHNVDLSGIDPNIARRLLRFNFRNRNQGKLSSYATNLVTQAAKIQSLEHVLNFYSVQYNQQVPTGRENPRIMAIELGNKLIVSSLQRQLRIAGHELWHAELRITNMRVPDIQYGTPEYAIHEVTVERLARQNMEMFFGDQYDPLDRQESINYELDWLKECYI